MLNADSNQEELIQYLHWQSNIAIKQVSTYN